jgi:hypothetical protein
MSIHNPDLHLPKIQCPTQHQKPQKAQKIPPLSPTTSKNLVFQQFFNTFEGSNECLSDEFSGQTPHLWSNVENKWLKRGDCGKLWEIEHLFSRQKKPTQDDRFHWRVQLQTRREGKTFHPVETSGTVPRSRWQNPRCEPRI